MRATWIIRLQACSRLHTGPSQKLVKLPLKGRAISPVKIERTKETNVLPLNNLPPSKNVLKLCKVQWTTAGKALAGHSKGISSYSSSFYIRAVPISVLPMPEASPFGPARRPPNEFTPFAVMTTIKGISKRAVQRNRVRTRFKEAVRLVLTRDARASGDPAQITVPLPSQSIGEANASLLLKGYCYSAQLQSIVYSLPMSQLVDQVRKSLQDIQRKKSLKEALPIMNRGNLRPSSKPKPRKAAASK